MNPFKGLSARLYIRISRERSSPSSGSLISQKPQISLVLEYSQVSMIPWVVYACLVSQLNK